MPTGWFVIEPPTSGVMPPALRRAKANFVGQQPTMGPLTPKLPKVLASLNGRVGPAGGIAGKLKKCTAVMNGGQTFTGGMGASLKRMTFTGIVTNNGMMSAKMKRLTSVSTGLENFTGALGAALKRAKATIQAAQTQSGTMAAISKRVTATMAGEKTLAVVSYPGPFASVPSDLVDIKSPSGSGATTVNSGALREAASSASNGTYFTIGILPNVMPTTKFSTEVTLAAANGSDRGVGGGASNASGTAMVFCVLSGTVNGQIFTIIGTTRTSRASFNIKATAAGDVVTMVPTVDGSGIVTWTAWKNGVATGLTWTDTAGLVGLPGNRPVIVFRHAYSGAQYYSPGISAITARELA